jgi:phospholipid/cholesterol/gamma-HCH transport system substrate-binding protein
MRLWSRLRKALRGQTGKNLAKFTLYTIACLVVLVYLVSLIGNIDLFASRHGYHAEVPDVTGLNVNDAVKIAGVAVGKVTGIHLEDDHARVDFTLDDDVRLHGATTFGIRWRNLLGQKYFYLYPNDQGPAVDPGGTLPLRNAVAAPDVGEFLNAIGPVLKAIDPAKANAFIEAVDEGLSGNEVKVQDLFAHAAQVADTVGGLDQKVGSLVDNLDQVVSAIAARNGDLTATITNLRNLAGTLGEHNGDLNALLAQFTQVQQRLDALITTNSGNLDDTVANLRSIVGVLSQHHADLEQGLATLPEGLLPYYQISSYGQWFQVRALLLCTLGGDDAPGQGSCLRGNTIASLLSPGATTAAKPSIGSVLQAVTGGATP